VQSAMALDGTLPWILHGLIEKQELRGPRCPLSAKKRSADGAAGAAREQRLRWKSRTPTMSSEVRNSRHVLAMGQPGSPAGIPTRTTRSLTEKIVNTVLTQTSECSSGPHAIAVCPPDLRYCSGPTTALAYAMSPMANAPTTFSWTHGQLPPPSAPSPHHGAASPGSGCCCCRFPAGLRFASMILAVSSPGSDPAELGDDGEAGSDSDPTSVILHRVIGGSSQD
jgi:hypothetical protein